MSSNFRNVGLPGPIVGHSPCIYPSSEDGHYSWSCTCGAHGARDILCREYAIDDWREGHGFDPLTNYPAI